jgi:serine/threonine protein kinase
VTPSIVASLRRWDPERIGPYAIIGRLGAGAMGQVYLARSVAGRLVAIKTIRVDLAEEAGFRARFAREVAAARRVSGVFTAAVIEADPEADLPWVATAYVPAPSLSTLVRRCGPLPVPAVRWLAAGCAEALQSIHRVGLLHRDVKPSNVLVAPDGPRVIDFGVARAAERVQLTVTREAAGTPAYMAPEQARDATQASPASDVFSLGATLVFAATGHAPYHGETVMDILVRLATEPPDLAGVPTELTDLVGGCLQRVPRDRPTGAAILGTLGGFAAEAGPGLSHLPESAIALISEYQHDPPLAGVPDVAAIGEETSDSDEAGEQTAGSRVPVAADDATSGSHTALPGFDSLAAVRAGQARRSRAGGSRRGRLPAARRPPVAWAAWSAVAIVLVGAGTGLGMLLRGPGAQAAGNLPPPPPPSSTTTGASTCDMTPELTSTPNLCVTQPYGDPDTVFVIHGEGFVPGTPITVRLVGVGVSRYHPVADQKGTFNYAIDQGHYFFSGQMPPAEYNVVATGADGRRAQVSFMVNAPGGGGPDGPPPSGPPPSGAPPSGNPAAAD